MGTGGGGGSLDVPIYLAFNNPKLILSLFVHLLDALAQFLASSATMPCFSRHAQPQSKAETAKTLGRAGSSSARLNAAVYAALTGTNSMCGVHSVVVCYCVLCLVSDLQLG